MYARSGYLGILLTKVLYPLWLSMALDYYVLVGSSITVGSVIVIRKRFLCISTYTEKRATNLDESLHQGSVISVFDMCNDGVGES